MSKKLGQHFLKDKRALRKIADALEINPRDVIVEVGPGHGELTEYLLAANPKKLIAVEKDKKLVGLLRVKSQATNDKSQTNSKSQIPIYKCLNIGYCLIIVSWLLVIF